MQRVQTEPYLSRYLHGRGAKLGLPVSGTFELTARCNFRCPMCYVHMEQAQIDARGRELTAQQWIDLAREAADQGMAFALLTGGEPFLRRDFFEIYHAIQSMGVMVSINSNGSMLSGEIRRRLLESPPFRINISLYGGCRETYRDMCGRDAFDEVVENIRALKEAGVDVSLNLSITPWNCRDLERIDAIARELGTPVRASSYMYPPIRVDGQACKGSRRLTAREAAECKVRWDLLTLEEPEFLRRAERMKELSAAEPRECAIDTEAGVSCRAGSSSFWLTWDGRMLPCGMMPFPEAYPLETGFGAAWQEIRNSSRQIRTPSACTTCEKREICPSCAAMCVTETGAFDQVPEYICRMTDETMAAVWEEYQKRRSNAQ